MSGPGRWPDARTREPRSAEAGTAAAMQAATHTARCPPTAPHALPAGTLLGRVRPAAIARTVAVLRTGAAVLAAAAVAGASAPPGAAAQEPPRGSPAPRAAVDPNPCVSAFARGLRCPDLVMRRPARALHRAQRRAHPAAGGELDRQHRPRAGRDPRHPHRAELHARAPADLPAKPAREEDRHQHRRAPPVQARAPRAALVEVLQRGRLRAVARGRPGQAHAPGARRPEGGLLPAGPEKDASAHAALARAARSIPPATPAPPGSG